MIVLVLSHHMLNAQTDVKTEDPEIDFLFNYYQQDGNHSPVTGGTGTEKLTNIAPMFIVNVPFDSINSINLSGGVDYYSSASSNKIDKYISSASSKYLSSASSSDIRAHADLAYTRKNLKNKSSATYMGGYSQEFDVYSANLGYSWTKTSADENREFSAKYQMYYDIWKIIIPAEFRDHSKEKFRNYPMHLGNDENDYALDKRISNNISLVFTQVLSQRLQFAVSSDFVYQKGLLYTPFHRVFFDDGQDNDTVKFWNSAVDVENLPDSRFKIPVGIRISYFPSDMLVIRFYYRYYYDDFGITSHTFNLETPIKVNPFFSVYPFVRYYTQTASKYFYPYGTLKVKEMNVYPLVPVEKYYTSDYDLSEFVNWKLGLGLRYSPVYGLVRAKVPYLPKWMIKFKSLDLRFFNYNRSDGFSAWAATIDCGFVLERKR